MPHWIDTPAALDAHLQRRPTRIGLDTEFVRERTYWPQLALVQIALDDDVLLVDPLAPGMTDALRPWLLDTSITKVMHSASEDLVAFKVACDALPSPLFDTQIAAAIAGIASGIGYQKLVERITGVALPKGETRSDWLRRPLSESQLHYAADDVRYLFAVHDALLAGLDATGRRSWVEEDCARFVDNAAHDEGERWPHLSMRSAQFLDADAQRRLVRLLRWRETQARASDKPRSWILDNELAVALARTPPEDKGALLRLFDTQPKAPRKLADAVWQALATPLDDESSMPVARAATDGDKAQVKRLQDAVSARSAELGLPDGVLASRRYLEALQESGQWPAALSGWRHRELAPVLTPILDRAGLAPAAAAG
ncbi:ribonuclease D [Pseudoxanthomonas sp. Root65]|uniref:ribonuclease D n=1 Tax=Pseudoxanthomonas sp. Root65 TaxID=1736576 RepID=UPI0006FBB60C|nr:ribonuclease D [Pseudoxanthomonas sp. Root65]KRA52541.1 ribonuclease D [Pseudoxanthomonas sp. Root65]